MFGHLAGARAWWSGGAKPSCGWRCYFYYHCTSVVLLGILAVTDARGWYLETWIESQPLVVCAVAYGALAVVLWPAALLSLIAPFISARLLWLARKGGPSFIAFALCDVLATCLQYLAQLVATG